ncbi:hypothetical protein D3C87_2093460 [compost metagenome]
MGFLEPLGLPIGHDTGFDIADLGAQAFELVFHRQLVSQQLLDPSFALFHHLAGFSQ